MPRSPIPQALEAFFRSLPKIELHCHLLGTIRRGTFVELASRASNPRRMTSGEIEDAYPGGDQPVGGIKVLRTLENRALTSPSDLERITVECLEDAAAHGVRYVELFWNPTGCARDAGISYPLGIDAICAGFRHAGSRHGIIARLIPSVDREAAASDAMQLVAWMAAYRREEVIGLGMDYREEAGPPQRFAEAYAAARKAGFRTTAHAGEFGLGWKNIETAVDVLKVDRVDHGYTVIDAPEFAARCADRGIVFTVVPTNTWYRRNLAPDRWAFDHPIRRMPELGLAIHPNTDDPPLHCVTPTGAWASMHLDFGFSLEKLREFMHNGIRGAWVDDGTRQRWHREFNAGFDRAMAAIGTGPA
jgi:adenosine deaminase